MPPSGASMSRSGLVWQHKGDGYCTIAAVIIHVKRFLGQRDPCTSPRPDVVGMRKSMVKDSGVSFPKYNPPLCHPRL